MGNAAIWIVGLGAAGLVFWLAERRRKGPRRKREAALQAVASRLGFTYAPEGDPYRQEPFLEQHITDASDPLRQGFYGFPHFLRGQCAAGPITIFDIWHGGPGHHDASKPYKATMAGFRLSGAALPPLHIEPEDKNDRFSNAVFKPVHAATGWGDIDFDDDPAFSDRYALHSGDETATRALFSPAFRAFWNSLPTESRLGAAANGETLVVYREPAFRQGREGALQPDAYDAFIHEAEMIVSAFRQALVR